MKLFQLFIIVLFTCTLGFSQKIIKHKVVNGESIFAIAKKYNISQAELLDLNPKYKNGVLKLNAVLEVPNKKYKEEKVIVKEKKVVEKKPIEKENTEVVTTINNEFITHLVASKETLYSISKKYGVTMETICETNPELKISALKMGSKIKILNHNFTSIPLKNNDVKSIDDDNFNEEDKSKPILETNKTTYSTPTVTHKVEPKETLYKISRIYKVDVRELLALNPSVKNGLPVGYNLIVKKGNDVISNNEIVLEPIKEAYESKPITLENSKKADFLIEKASQNIGVNYRSGGTTNAGFDCSGFMFATFKEIDLILPRTSQEQSNYGYKIDKSEAQKGDLIFFATRGSGRVSHVGMVIEVLNNEIKFIHSSTSSGVMISSCNEEYYSKRFVQVNRVLPQ